MKTFISLHSSLAPKATLHVTGCSCVATKRVGMVRSQPFEALSVEQALDMVRIDAPEGVKVTTAKCALDTGK